MELKANCRDVAGDQADPMVRAIRGEYEKVWNFLDRRLAGDR